MDLDGLMKDMGTISVSTGVCFGCGCEGSVVVGYEDYVRWMNGELIQRCFPELPEGEREQLISGLHPVCWDRVMSGEGV
jgi:hypothetical protein